jgi:hypothetical protein
MWTLPRNIPIPTTPVDEPYRVHLEAVPGHFQEVTVGVHDHVLADGRRIVRSASGDGFWHVPDHRVRDDEIPRAVFAPDPRANFICHLR